MKHLQHILIPNSQNEPVEVMEVVGTGLAIYCEYNPFCKRDEYTLIHLASGSRLIADFVIYFTSACRWLLSIKDITDWTQPESSLKERHDIEMIVREARL